MSNLKVKKNRIVSKKKNSVLENNKIGTQSLPVVGVRAFTGQMDYMLPVDEMPEKVITCLFPNELPSPDINPSLEQIFSILYLHTGHDFSSYKINTIYRRIEKQMLLNQLDTLQEYVKFLQTYPNQVNEFFKDMLIGVTQFFRDPEAYEALKLNIISKILENQPKDYNIRVWIPGCSTGEEVYSIAILIHECLEELNCYYNVQVFGTDIDLNALEVARAGIYRESIANAISESRLKRFFIKENQTYRVRTDIRSRVIFGEQDIVKDPPFTKLDMICCRNLLIYLNTSLQNKILPIFHYSLKSKGILFLGASEAILGHNNLFHSLSNKWKIFEKKDTVAYTYPSFNFSTMPNVPRTNKVNDSQLIGEEYETIEIINRFLDENVSKKNLGLEEEIQYTKENLQIAIEKLRKSNEKLQSTNEELQSTNEEIETSKEELRSLNEELVIVNTELQAKIDQLAKINDDMKNLFNSVEIAAIFLDKNLCVARFTSSVQKIFHLIESDIGRPLLHIANTLYYENMLGDIQNVIKSAIAKTIEVQSKNNNYYCVRILPYRTLSNEIDGAIIMFNNITQHKKLENKLKEADNLLKKSFNFTKSIIDSINNPILLLTDDLKIISANQIFYKFFNVRHENVLNHYLYEIENGQWNNSLLRKKLKNAVAKSISLKRFEVNLNFPNLGIFVLSILNIFRDELGKNSLLLIIREKLI